MATPATTERDLRRPAEAGGTRTAELEVSGMTCGSCAARVKRALERQEGVGDAVVNYATGRATVELLDGTVDDGSSSMRFARPATTRCPRPTAHPNRPRRSTSRSDVETARTGLPAAPHRPRSAAGGGDRRAHLRRPTRPDGPLAHAPRSRCRCSSGAGWPFLRSAWARARARSTNMDTLIALSTLASFGYSTVHAAEREPGLPARRAGRQVRHAARLRHGRDHHRRAAHRPLVRGHARAAAPAARCASSRTSARTGARLLDADDPERPGAAGRRSATCIGATSSGVRPGDRVPVDGIVLAGASAVDESMLTGESFRSRRAAGALVSAGDREPRRHAAGSRHRRRRATRPSPHLIALVERAQACKPQIQRLADDIARIFVPAVLVLAALTALGWLLTGQSMHGMFPSMHIERGMDATIAVLDRRVSLRARAGDTRRDPRRHRARREPGPAHQQRRDPRTQPRARHDRARQDGHGDHRRAVARRHLDRPRDEEPTRLSRSPPAPKRLRAPGRARHRGRGARAGAGRSARPRSFRSIPGRGVRAVVDGAARLGRSRDPRGRSPDGAARGRSIAWESSGAHRRSSCERDGRTSSGRWPSPTRSSPRPAARSRASSGWGSRSSCSPATTREPRARSPRPSASSASSPASAPSAKLEEIARLQGEGRRVGWSATASTTPPRSPRPTSGSRWAPGVGAAIEAADISIALR